MAGPRLSPLELVLLRAIAAEGWFPFFRTVHGSAADKLTAAGLVIVDERKFLLTALGREVLEWAVDARSDIAIEISKSVWDGIEQRARRSGWKAEGEN